LKSNQQGTPKNARSFAKTDERAQQSVFDFAVERKTNYEDIGNLEPVS
jgi:hypothetical protein